MDDEQVNEESDTQDASGEGQKDVSDETEANETQEVGESGADNV